MVMPPLPPEPATKRKELSQPTAKFNSNRMGTMRALRIALNIIGVALVADLTVQLWKRRKEKELGTSGANLPTISQDDGKT